MKLPALLVVLLIQFGQAHGHDDSSDSHEAESIGFGPDVHSHPAGEENHGTEWFFNQPWSARETWGSLLRDSAILSGMAAGVFLLSGTRKRR